MKHVCLTYLAFSVKHITWNESSRVICRRGKYLQNKNPLITWIAILVEYCKYDINFDKTDNVEYPIISFNVSMEPYAENRFKVTRL